MQAPQRAQFPIIQTLQTNAQPVYPRIEQSLQAGIIDCTGIGFKAYFGFARFWEIPAYAFHQAFDIPGRYQAWSTSSKVHALQLPAINTLADFIFNSLHIFGNVTQSAGVRNEGTIRAPFPAEGNMNIERDRCGHILPEL
jgi:hypothetical protein